MFGKQLVKTLGVWKKDAYLPHTWDVPPHNETLVLALRGTF